LENYREISPLENVGVFIWEIILNILTKIWEKFPLGCPYRKLFQKWTIFLIEKAEEKIGKFLYPNLAVEETASDEEFYQKIYSILPSGKNLQEELFWLKNLNFFFSQNLRKFQSACVSFDYFSPTCRLFKNLNFVEFFLKQILGRKSTKIIEKIFLEEFPEFSALIYTFVRMGKFEEFSLVLDTWRFLVNDSGSGNFQRIFSTLLDFSIWKTCDSLSMQELVKLLIERSGPFRGLGEISPENSVILHNLWKYSIAQMKSLEERIVDLQNIIIAMNNPAISKENSENSTENSEETAEEILLTELVFELNKVFNFLLQIQRTTQSNPQHTQLWKFPVKIPEHSLHEFHVGVPTWEIVEKDIQFLFQITSRIPFSEETMGEWIFFANFLRQSNQTHQTSKNPLELFLEQKIPNKD
jgi:hypothetical protein